MNRRSFLKSAAAVIAAPAIVRAQSLMPIWVPPQQQLVLPAHSVVIDELGITIFRTFGFDVAYGPDQSIVFSVRARTGEMMMVGALEEST